MAILIITDRDRDVEYNGLEISCNTFKCSECGTLFILERPSPGFCPRCGEKFDDFEDISI